MNNSHHKKCAIYSHMGDASQAVDNTRLAFSNALRHNIDGIETDVQLTKDQVAVIYHNRLMTELGYSESHICDFTFEQLNQINFADSCPTANHEGPIRLAEFISSYRDSCKLQIEIKHRDWEDYLSAQIKVQQCLEFIGDAKNNEVILSSFTEECLEYAYQLDTRIPLIYAFRNTHSFSDVKNYLDRYPFVDGVCHPIATLDEALTSCLQNSNKQVLAYTCNRSDDIRKALDLKVDILITDDPALAIKMRD